ncbi:MAG: class I SAM-dependent methyltransferase [Brachybacterium sp.]|nr:class I SAM-dependent methyltransferase [Brachybacterium sp.]
MERSVRGVRQFVRNSVWGTIPRILEDLPTARLLDAGSGNGSLISTAIARNREAVAIDADPDMVAMTNAAAPGTCERAVLPNLPFPDSSFGAVAANFVVNHLEEPRAGVEELARVLASGGQLAMTIWPQGGAGWASLVDGAFEDAGATPWQGTRLPPEQDFPRTPDGLAMLAEAAGLEIISSETLTWTWEVDASALWSGIEGGVATPGARYRAQTAAIQEETRIAFERRSAELASHGRLCFRCSASYVLAVRPFS